MEREGETLPDALVRRVIFMPAMVAGVTKLLMWSCTLGRL